MPVDARHQPGASAVPPQAITDASPAAAIMRAISDPGSIVPRLSSGFAAEPGDGWLEPLIEWQTRAVIEAAGPHLEAAQAERLAAWLEGPEAAAVTAGAIRAQVDREIAEAVAAERERLAQLAEQNNAWCVKPGDEPWKPFAALLREQP